MVECLWGQGAIMTKPLEEAFAELSKLSAGEQHAIASWLLEELASELMVQAGPCNEAHLLR